MKAAARSRLAEHGGGSDIASALRASELMRASDPRQPLDSLACTTLLVAAAHASDPSQDGGGASLSLARKIVDYMKRHHIKMNHQTFTALMLTCARARDPVQGGGADVEGAWRALRDMEYHHVQPDEVAYITMLEACANGRSNRHNGGADVEGAWRAYAALTVLRPKPSLAHMVQLLRACSHSRLVQHGGGADSPSAARVMSMLEMHRLDVAYYPVLLEYMVTQDRAERCGACCSRLYPLVCHLLLQVACARANLPGADVERAMMYLGAVPRLQHAWQQVTVCAATMQACARAQRPQPDGNSPGGADVAAVWQVWQTAHEAMTGSATASEGGSSDEEEQSTLVDAAVDMYAWMLHGIACARTDAGATDVAAAMRVLGHMASANVALTRRGHAALVHVMLDGDEVQAQGGVLQLEVASIVTRAVLESMPSLANDSAVAKALSDAAHVVADPPLFDASCCPPVCIIEYPSDE